MRDTEEHKITQTKTSLRRRLWASLRRRLWGGVSERPWGDVSEETSLLGHKQTGKMRCDPWPESCRLHITSSRGHLDRVPGLDWRWRQSKMGGSSTQWGSSSGDHECQEQRSLSETPCTTRAGSCPRTYVGRCDITLGFRIMKNITLSLQDQSMGRNNHHDGKNGFLWQLMNYW